MTQNNLSLISGRIKIRDEKKNERRLGMATKQWLVVLLLLVLSSELVADKFARTFGDSTLNQTCVYVQQTSDSGYFVAGNATPGEYEMLVLKLSSAGDTEWSKAYGTSTTDYLQSARQTSDGGYILAGVTHLPTPWYRDGLLIKLNSTGAVQWTKTFGIPDTNWIHYMYDIPRSIRQTSGGGYIVAGFSGFFGMPDSTWVIKFNSAGGVEWSRSFGGWYDVASSEFPVRQTSDAGYIIGGTTDSYGAGSSDFLVLKLNSAGDLEWAKTYGGTSYESLYEIQQTSDSGYIITGWTRSYGAGDLDFLVLKLNSAGDLEWAKTYGGADADSPENIEQTSDGGYIVAGNTSSFGAGSSDVLIIKLSSAGDLEWAKTHGGSDLDYARSVQQTSDNGYIIGGNTRYGSSDYFDLLVCKLEYDGAYTDCFYDCSLTVTTCSPDISSPSVISENWTPYVGSPSLNVSARTLPVDDVCAPVVTVEENVGRDTPGSIYLEVIPSVGKNDFCINYRIPKSMDISNIPTVTLKLYDATGRLERVLFEKNIRCRCQCGAYTRSVDLGDLSAGIYFLRLEVGNRYRVKKAILLR
jgi:hypothetical protein